jgi:hypothetical protein
VKQLSKLTESGTIDWKPSINVNTFQVSFRDNTLRITSRPNENEQDFLVQLVNSNGELVETFSDLDLNDSDEPTESRKSWFGILRDLYENARRKALGADKVLDEIIADLDEADDIPF